MSLDVLASGKIVKPPQARTSANGKSYATLHIVVSTEADETCLLSLVAFRPPLVEALLALEPGDSLCVAGRGKPTAWADRVSGEPRAGLQIVVEQLLTPYHVSRRRRAAQGDDRGSEVSTPSPPPIAPPGRPRAPARGTSETAGGIAALVGDDPFGR